MNSLLINIDCLRKWPIKSYRHSLSNKIISNWANVVDDEIFISLSNNSS